MKATVTIILTVAALFILWGFFIAFYLFYYLDDAMRHSFFSGDPNLVGDFLSGAFAPLGLMLFVITLVVQSMELRAQREELKNNVSALIQQKEQLERTAKSNEKQIELLVEESRRNSFARFTEDTEILMRDLRDYFAANSDFTVAYRYYNPQFKGQNSGSMIRLQTRIAGDPSLLEMFYKINNSLTGLNTDMKHILHDLDLVDIDRNAAQNLSDFVSNALVHINSIFNLMTVGQLVIRQNTYEITSIKRELETAKDLLNSLLAIE